MYQASNPLIVQSDHTVLLELASPGYEAARDQLSRFAELEKSPEHVHTYRISPLSLWNAAASGMQAQGIVAALAEYGKYELPENVRREILDQMSRYGRIKLTKEADRLLLGADDDALLTEILHHPKLQGMLLERRGPFAAVVEASQRGNLKQALIKIGYPVEDLAGYVPGEHLEIALRDITLAGLPLVLRDYQREAVAVFHADGSARGGSGVIVLPCGAGKTVVGLAVMAAVDAHTLILTPNTVAVRQWIHEIIDKTAIDPASIGEYTGALKQVRPVTVATYQTLTYRRKGAGMPHLSLLGAQDWGLIIYDEVHLLPAPVFRATADIQARRRLGLTATLIREDGHADEVFSLIGPKKVDVPWKDLEAQGWIATAQCTEIRLAMPSALRMDYALADQRLKYGIAASNPDKMAIIERLLERHAADTVLIIGQYMAQLQTIADHFDLPLITGETPVRRREALYQQLRDGEIHRLVVSKVANFSIDLPDANVAIQVSGTFGSRQEEAQRLGRILRPKAEGIQAHFYSLVSRDSLDQDFGAARQRFLTEQGYRYHIVYAEELEAIHGQALETA
ncbi:MAG TPA: DEAD/DEAH box helicase [Anaerolineae bacterium]|nr:DEAD/DEAH box helicase [Anaerolineae bacterium]